MKKTTSVYVSDEKIDLINQKGINLSQVVETTLDTILSDDFDDLDISMRLRYNEDEILKLKQDVATLTAQIDIKRLRLNYLIDDNEKMQREWEESKQTVRLARLTRQLNKIIIASGYCEYDVKVSADTILTRICEANPHFELTAHIERFKKIMNR